MPGIYLNIYIQALDDMAFNRFKAFVNAIESKNFERVKEMDFKGVLHDIESIFAFGIKSVIKAGIINIQFSFGHLSLKVDEIISFFISLGTKNIEASAYYNVCDEYIFYKNSHKPLNHYRYFDVVWNLLKNPFPSFLNENIVLTGTFSTSFIKGLKNYIRQNKGIVRNHISKKVTLVVMGKVPDSDIIGQAIALNIPILSPEKFKDKYKL